jgi:hypothetical protein
MHVRWCYDLKVDACMIYRDRFGSVDLKAKRQTTQHRRKIDEKLHILGVSLAENIL